ncbi:MAG: hypothetical protein KIT56_05640 [Gammaproteobacteria bacterium]|nr:hypothetical protein [Gammaproteobacteria bacterium]MCW5583353.1 hypothetical protein [Gammaproteobacteria bacterium]
MNGMGSDQFISISVSKDSFSLIPLFNISWLANLMAIIMEEDVGIL